jgi:hypothetical protein
MSDSPSTVGSSPSPTDPLRPEQAIGAFESAWDAVRSGAAPPRIEDFLLRVPEADRPPLLRGLVRNDIVRRISAGESPAASDYLARFPELDPNWLAVLFGNEPRTLQH